MDYEQKFKGAMSFLKDLRPHMSDYCKEKLDGFFPELKESEDEKNQRIKKEVIEMLHYYHSKSSCFIPPQFSLEETLAWLEKQGEQKPADKVESKFKIEKDKWYICIRDLDDNYGTRAFCKGCTYHSTKDETLIPDNSNIPFEIKYCVNDYFRLWTIQDAKDGDVLYSPCCKLLWIYKDEKTCHIGSNLNYNPGSIVVNTPICIPNDVQPATKEQRELLFSKMKEAGYEWDAEKKELKKIEQASTWSEEDSKRLLRIHQFIWANRKGDTDEIYQQEQDADWLMTLKPQPKQEWSDEDETQRINAIIMLKEGASKVYTKDSISKCADWLKSLKPWKPTKEQMEALRSAMDFVISLRHSEILESLYKDLKSL